MKAIICYCDTVHIHTFTTDWTACSCGNVKARWIDPKRGTVVAAAKDRSKVRLLGMNNDYLIHAIKNCEAMTWREFRMLHAQAVDAPGYLFDIERIGCWAVIVEIGRSNDVRWATEEEFAEAFPS